MKVHAFVVAFLLSAPSLSAQSDAPIIVHFKLRTEADPNRSEVVHDTRHIRPDSTFRNFPADCSKFAIREFALRSDQYYFEAYLSGALSTKKWLNMVKRYKIDTASLSQIPVPGNLYHAFIGISSQGEKIVILDKNQDRDFSNDIRHQFDTAFCSKPDATWPPFPGITLQTARGPLKLHINPYISSLDEGEQRDYLNLEIWNKTYWKGEITVDGLTKKVIVDPAPVDVFQNPRSPWIKLRFEDDSTNGYRYGMNELLAIGGGLYSWDHVPGDEQNTPIIAIRKVQQAPGFDATAGSVVPAMAFREFVTGQPMELAQFSGKYMILDFWGTWCAPCMKLVPEMVKHHEKLKNLPVEMISIALDNRADEALLRETILSKKMDWIHIWQERETNREAGSVTKLFKVQQFPTFILIDPDGKIIYRGSAAEGYHEMVKHLDARLATL